LWKSIRNRSRPAQRYVLQEGVQAILDVADAFEPRGIDVFALRGALLFWPEGSDPDGPADSVSAASD
jgi:hypothetical protein